MSTDDLLYPMFVKEGLEEKQEIVSMSGQFHYPLKELDELVSRCEELGVPGILLFGIPKHKDELGSQAFSDEGMVQRAIQKIKHKSDLMVFTDLCLCQYTSHGHCGVVDERGLNNDATLEILNKVALSHADAGADFVAPSGMIDGQVKSIREALDRHGYHEVGIMSYSAKFASNFYGPFREAAESAPQPMEGEANLSNRDTYQMDYRTVNQPLFEISLDVKEGADIVMVKPALPYLDLIQRVKERFDVPLAAYQVSGEYAMMKEASKSGLLKEREIFLESLISMKRAGADFIITYASLEVARWLNEN